MVRPSNPRLMARVLDAVVNLSDTRGSSAREVLSFIRQCNVSAKNLTVQVQRALKNAVNAGLLRHRSGRYKVLATLNTASEHPTQPVNKEPIGSDKKTEEKKSRPDVKAPIDDMKSTRRTQERKKSSRRRSSRHRTSKARRKSRRSPYARRPNASGQSRKRRQRKRAYEDEEFEEQSTGRYVLHGRNGESSVPFNRRAKRSRVAKRELESDFSDESDRESDVSRKRVSRASRSLYREPKRKEARAKSRGRSALRTRSSRMLQRTMQARQLPIEEVKNDRQQCDEDHESTESNVARQDAHEDVEGAREPNDSNSGSTLENSRD